MGKYPEVYGPYIRSYGSRSLSLFLANRDVIIKGDAVLYCARDMTVFLHEFHTTLPNLQLILSNDHLTGDTDLCYLVACTIEDCGGTTLQLEGYEDHLEAPLKVKERIVQTAQNGRYKELIRADTFPSATIGLGRIIDNCPISSGRGDTTSLSVPFTCGMVFDSLWILGLDTQFLPPIEST